MQDAMSTPIEWLSNRVLINHATQTLVVDGKELPATATGGSTVATPGDVAKSGFAWASVGATVLSALYFVATNPDQVMPYLNMLPPGVAIPVGAAIIGIGTAYRFYQARKGGIVSAEEKKKIERAGY